MAITTIEMPDADELMRRLMGVDNSGHLAAKLYPGLVRSLAGQKKAGGGIVMSLQLALTDYTEGMPPQMFQVMMFRRRAFIEGMLTGDQAVIKADALKMLDTLIAQGN